MAEIGRQGAVNELAEQVNEVKPRFARDAGGASTVCGSVI
jgi:hypothetical protein